MKIVKDNLHDLLVFNIKYYRYVNNFSQEKLAELSKLSPRYITDVERGLHCPTIQKIELISKALNIEPYMLLLNPDRDEVIIDRMNNCRQYNEKKVIAK
jgi:transcriptional regulator with XRE-family HTH domain